jgi:hypothetical protein
MGSEQNTPIAAILLKIYLSSSLELLLCCICWFLFIMLLKLKIDPYPVLSNSSLENVQKNNSAQLTAVD